MLLALFILVPALELYLLVGVGGLLGFWPTVFLIIVTGAVGASLARREGFRVLAEWQEAMAVGRIPAEGVTGGLLVLVGGLLLITPGILTDVLGFALMLPGLRRAVGGWLRALWGRSGRFQAVQVVSSMSGARSPQGGPGAGSPGRIIDVEGEVLSVDGRPIGDTGAG